MYEYTIDCHKRVPCVQSNVIGVILQCEQERGNVEDMFAVPVKQFFSPFVASTHVHVPAFHLPQTFCQLLSWKSSNYVRVYILLKSYMYIEASLSRRPRYMQLVVLINAAATIGGRRLLI